MINTADSFRRWAHQQFRTRPSWFCQLTTAVGIMLLTGSVSIAQPAPPAPAVPVAAPLPAAPTIPTTIKMSPSLTAEDVALVKQIVSTEAANLSASDPETQSQARDALVMATRVDGSTSKSSSPYLFEYTLALDPALQPLTRDPSRRVRLNVAIIAARVGADAPGQSLNLQKTVELLLKNETDPAVLIWVFKALQPILPQSLTNPALQYPAANPLVGLTVAKALEHPSGPVIEEAYQAITLGWQGTKAKLLTAPMFQSVIPAVQEMMRARISMYKNGIPQDPILEANYGLLFLTDTKVLQIETAPQKLAAVQLLHDLTYVAAARAASAPRVQKEELISLLQIASKYFQRIADYEKAEPTTLSAMKGLATLSSTTPPAVILDAAKNALEALRRIPAYSRLSPPPELSASSATSSTSPTP